jgi:hypothetical protein
MEFKSFGEILDANLNDFVKMHHAVCQLSMKVNMVQ